MTTTINPTQQSVLNVPSNDKFLLVLNLPTILKQRAQTDSTISLEPLEVKVYGTIVPSIIVPSTEVRFGGQSHHVSSYSRPAYPPLDVNFVIDNGFKNYWLLWKWLSILNDPLGSYYSGTPLDAQPYKTLIQSGSIAEYCTTFSIFGLDEYNNQIIEFIYYNAFITNLGPINYNYRDTNYIESTVQFQFSQLDINLLS
jgi:hypothetical protein